MFADQDNKKDFRVAVGAEPADRAISPLRPDLKISPQTFYGQLCFVIKDPVTLRYFRLQPVEHFLATQLDGHRTARDLLTILQQKFPESALSVQDMLRFIGMLHDSHLLVGEGAAHAEWLASSASTSRKSRILSTLQNFLFLKLPLFNPDPLLNVLHASLGRIIYHPLTGLLALLLIAGGIIQVLAHVDRLQNLPYSLLGFQNLFVLYCVFVITKVFHEFGHGLTAKHFGGEVSQMGVMLFILTPAFYCDTSDAWMIPSRKARLWINAGGVTIELVIAALAAFVWVYTQEDTLVSQIALNVMITCSAATLFFNANPLLRYDGYYFLADLLEIPNLMSKGRDFLKYYALKYLLGMKPTLPPDSKRILPLVTYAVAGGIYRWSVYFGIVILLYHFFDQHGLGPIGVLLGIIYVLTTILRPVCKSVAFLWKQRWDLSRRLVYVTAAAGLGCAALALAALMPWTMTIREPLVILSEHDETIAVRTPGYVESVEVDAGESVQPGQVIVRLRDPALQSMLDRAIARRDQQLIMVTNARAANQPGAVAAAQTSVDAFDKQIELIRQRLGDLVLRSPIAGVVVRESSLKRITGNYVAPGTALCRIIDTTRLQARISLPQQKAALVTSGMPVKIRLWTEPGTPLLSSVARVSSTVSDQLLHPALASTLSGEIEVTADKAVGTGGIKSTGRRSTVIIDLPPTAAQQLFLCDGLTGRGEITVRRTTLIGRLYRAILDSTTPDWHL